MVIPAAEVTRVAAVADNVNAVDAGYVLKPPIDAIAEFKILTHNANAEFGRNTGSTTNIVTRGGTNSFHGAAWEFLRNDAMDSSDYFTRSVQPLKQNQFGATFGGPILKDKTFFFGYYEGFRNRQGETVPATVPSLAERQGNFAEQCTAGFGSSGLCANAQQQLTFFGTPVPFNQMTLFTPIDPIATNVLPFFPLPNKGVNGFIATQTLSENNDQFGLRLDHYLSRADTLNFRYMYSSGPTTDPLSPVGANVPGFPVGEDDRAQNFVAQETHIFSPTTIGVARFSYLRNKFLLDEHLNHESPSDLGFQYDPTLLSAAGPPFIQVGGYASVGDPITGPRNTFQNTFDLSGSLSWIHGRHELKFGGGYRRDQINALQGIASNGFFVFANFPYSDGFASFLSGNPVVFLQGGGDFSREIRDRALDAYGQDNYKVTSNLTLNLGLRYELPFPSTENKNRVNLFVPGAQSTVNSQRSGGSSLSRRSGRAGRLDSNPEDRFRSANRLRVGPARRLQDGGQRGLRNFLRAVLHRRGWAAAGSGQRSSLPQDSANKFSRQLICQSVLYAESLQSGVPRADDTARSRSQPASALRAGLESEYSTVFWRGLAISDWVRRHHRCEAAAIH